MSFESLIIHKIKKCYTEDVIINIFWKYFLGKIYRVDFEDRVNLATGVIDPQYQTAIIYKNETNDWNDEIIKSINESGTFILYHTNFDGSNDCWTMEKFSNPTPRSITTRNIHQLQHENNILKARISALEAENKKLKDLLVEL